MHQAGLDVIAKLHRENRFDNCLPQRRVLDRVDDFDTPVKVPRHEIGAPEKNLLVPAVAEVIDPRVFEEPADDCGDPDVLTDAGNTWPETADAPDLQLDLHPGLRGRIERRDAGRVDEGVHLEDEVPVTLLLLAGNLPVDLFQHDLPQGYRSNEQFVVLLDPGITGQEIEEVCHILADLPVAGQEAEIGIDAARGRVVVPGTKVHVAPDPVLLATHHHAELRMHLETDDPVHDVDAFPLQRPGPPDIVLLIEPGLELDQGSHGLAVLAGLHERIDNRGVGTDPVEGDLDREHVRVMGSLPDKVDDRREAVVGLVEQDVVVPDRGKDIAVIGKICRESKGGTGYP